MDYEWIIIEILAILVEVSALLYFLNKRYESKYISYLPQIFGWVAIILWGMVATFSELPVLIYEAVYICLLSVYLLLSKQGRVLQKLFGAILGYTILSAITMAGAGLASILTNTSYQHSLEFQDISRVVAITFIKTLQIIVFYALTKKRSDYSNLKRQPLIVLCAIALLDLVCILLIWVYIQTPEFSAQKHLLVALSIGLLIFMVALFVMYELFIREEKKNTKLFAQVQMLELESTFYQNIDVMYTDMRKWRHDYKNNLTALHSLVKEGNTEDTLDYIEKIAEEPLLNQRTLQTGNLVLDAVVSSKLWLAHSKGIKISVQAVYADNDIEANDLCAIAGNLLDNAIEACGRMLESDARFIDFSIVISGMNLLIIIRNSFNGEVKQNGSRYESVKHGKYHGIGIPHVDSIISKYQGHVKRDHENNIFETRVMIPLLDMKG